MSRAHSYGLLGLLTLAACSASSPGNRGDPHAVQPNDNRQAAGKLAAGVLTLALETRSGVWHPEGAGSRGLDSVAAFAEVGQGMTTPGPLIRVPTGTTVRGTVHNTLGRALTVFGLGKARSDSLKLAAGDSARFEFTAATPGTYFYFARSGLNQFGLRPVEDTQLNGVIVVDGPNPAPDRILAMSWYFTIAPQSPTGLGHGTMAINGLSWPHTERLGYAQGDSIRWRVLNFTESDHPMHLHGFYFRMNAKGDGLADTLYAAAQQRMAVTEVILPFQSMALAWQADRPGNWIFHCHYATHISGVAALDTENGVMDSSMLAHHQTDKPHQMFGLVMGISVAPKGTQAAVDSNPRAIRIVQREKPGVYGSQTGMSFVMDGTPEAADPTALAIPGPVLLLERGKRVAVTIVNRSQQHAAVHWHGIELESYPDGVPGWSGTPGRVFQAIAPGDSFTAEFTPPRAGSFMYHAHADELIQILGGLYGPLVVLAPGETFDTAANRLVMVGSLIEHDTLHGVVNGRRDPAPIELRAARTYRFRLFNIGDARTSFALRRPDSSIVAWRAVAKDGAELPPAQAVPRTEPTMTGPGEILDFELNAGAPEDLVLDVDAPFAPWRLAVPVRIR